MAELLEDRVLLSSNTLSTAVPLDIQSTGQTVQADNVAVASDVRLFAVPLVSGQAVTIDIDAEVLSSTLDALVRVFDPTGNQVAQVDNLTTRNERPLDSPQLDPELAFHAVTTGTWFIGISSSGNDSYAPTTGTGVDGNSSGAFTLTVTLDSGATTETATPVVITEGNSATLTETISVATDRDSYRIDLTAGQVVEAVVRTAGLAGDLASRIELYGPDVSGLGLVDTGSSDQPVFLYRVTQTGPYYFDILSSTVTSTVGDYEVTFRILTSDQVPVDTVGDTFDTAESVSVATGGSLTVSAEIEFNNDADLFAVDLNQGEQLSVDVDANVLSPPSLLDSFIAVFDADGNMVAENDESTSTGGPDSALAFRAPSTGRYFVGVTGFRPFRSGAFDPNVDGSAKSTSRGRYNLAFSIEEAETPSPTSGLRFVSADTPVSVSGGITQITIDVPVDFPVLDVNVELSQNILAEDLKLTLISPSGTRVTLADSPGFFAETYDGVIFDDEASSTLGRTFGTHTGSFIPSESLNAFSGESSAGTWVLETEVNGFAFGPVSNFAIQLEPPPEFASRNVPVTIVNNATVTSQLVITDDITIADVDVELDIIHPFNFDLRVFLISPDGTRVELFADVGFSEENFSGTILDDEADTSINVGSGPFSGRFRPEGTLSDFDGKSTIRTWTLEITDTFFLDSGILNSWSLHVLPTGSVGGFVFLDLDQNGLRNGPEPGLAGTTVFADSNNNGLLDDTEQSVVTDSTGLYLLRGLSPGAAVNVVASTPAGLTPVSSAQTITALAGKTIAVNLGFSGLSSIRGTVFFDEDGSEIQSSDERGLINSTVFVDLNANGLADIGEPVAITASDGTFEIAGLAPGVHQLSIAENYPLVTPTDNRLFVTTTAGATTESADFAVRFTSVFDSEPNNTSSTATPIAPTTVTNGALTAGDIDFYELTIDQTGRLQLNATPVSDRLDVRLRLLTVDDAPILVSNSSGSVDSSASLDVHLSAGTYRVEITGENGSVGGYRLSSSFSPAESPVSAIVPTPPIRGFERESVVAGDFNGDGILDMATADVRRARITVLIGEGDGSFRDAYSMTVDAGPRFLGVYDLNNDGILDLVSANGGGDLESSSNDTVSVFLGAGNATFAPEFLVRVGDSPREVTASDFNGDGILDLATSNFASDDVSILIGQGDGTFQNEFRIDVGTEPESLTAADLNHDGNVDVAVANRQTEALSILLGDGAGAFTAGPDATVSSFSRTQSVRHGDVNRDGIVDLVTTNESNFAEILLGNGNGTFQTASEVPVGEDAEIVLLEDLTGDGILELATANRFSNDVSIRIGIEDGSFGTETRLPVEFDPVMLVSGDFNGDGQQDIAVANRGDISLFPDGGDGSISLLINRGDGEFQTASDARLLADDVPTTIVIADIDNDNRPDLITANQSSTANGGNITVLAGLGTGVFGRGTLIDLKARSLAVADVNQDGRLDIVSVNGRDVGLRSLSRTRAEIPGSLSVFLGLGNGEFETAGQFDVGMNAISVALADFNSDSVPDVVTVNEFPDSDTSENGTLSVLIGNGDGSFGAATSIEAGIGPSSVVAEDIDRDGHMDLAVTNRGAPFGTIAGLPGAADDRVFVYWGLGNGTFESPQIEAVGDGPKELIAVDLNLDGFPELVTVNRGTREDFFGTNNTISILSPSSDSPRQLSPSATVTVPQGPTDLVSGDFNGDGNPDLAVAGSTGNLVGVLLGRGDLTFSAQTTFSLASALQPESLQTADLNGDGFLDLAVANLNSDDVSVLLGIGDGSFVPADQIAKLVEQAGPITADVNADGLDDVASIDQNGQILVRAGRDSREGLLAPPFVLNPEMPARAIQTFHSGTENLTAAVSRDGSTLTLYGFDADGRPEVRQQTELPGFVSVFSVRDVTGDGHDDIVGALPIDGQIVLIRNDGSGGFANPEQLDVGQVPAAVDLVDLDSLGGLDIVVTSRDSAVAHLFLNDGSGNFATPLVHPTSTAPIVLNPNNPPPGSLTLPVGQALGDFNGDGLTDFLVVNQGERSFQLLKGTGNGSFADPSVVTLPASVIDESVFGGLLLTRDLTGTGPVNQVIASAPGASVITIMGLDGGVSLNVEQELSTGASVAGISLADMNADSLADLLVNTSTGDLIIFPGLDGGRFGEFFRTQSTVPIAVQDLDGDGRPDVITANSAFDRVNIDFKADANSDVVLSDSNAQFAAPGAIELGDINGDGLDDLIVANTGGNEVFLFPRLSAQSFATEPIVLFSGTNPTGISVDDVNADGRIDLVVANRGSNDVTIFLGMTTTDTGFDTGRRLAAGVGPVSADVMLDEATGEVTSLIVTNADAGTVSMLPAVEGLGGSIFNDQAASTIAIGQTSAQGGQLIGNSFVATNPLDDSFTFIPDLQNAFLTGAGITTFSSQGDEPSFTLPTDFNFDGILDLIVANSGDGSIALFAGGDIGFVFSDLLSAPSLAHPSTMDIAEINGVLNLFVTEEGEDVASIFQLGQNAGQNSPFPILFPPLVAQGNDGFRQPDNQVQSALAALTNLLLASLDLNDEQATTAQARNPIDERAPAFSRWLRRANDALSSLISPYLNGEITFGATIPRGVEPASGLIRSLFQTAIVTPFPLFGLLTSPVSPLSVSPDSATEKSAIESDEGVTDPVGQPDSKPSDQPAEADQGAPADSEDSASATHKPSRDQQSRQETAHAVFRRRTGQSSRRTVGIAGFDYQRIDGAFADVASRSLFAERLFDEAAERERFVKRQSGEADGGTSHHGQTADLPRYQDRRSYFQQSPIGSGISEESRSTRESSQGVAALTTIGLTGHYLGRAHRSRNGIQVRTERRRGE